jgi:hypothetical protein
LPSFRYNSMSFGCVLNLELLTQSKEFL